VTITRPAATGTVRPPESASEWAPLPVLLAGAFMAVLDLFIVNVAIPTTQHDLNAGANSIEWIVAGYSVAYAAGLITGGRLGDVHGRRRVFAFGLALFVLTSAACGAAPTSVALVAARVAQGAAAALMMPQVLAIIGVLYQGADRVKALTAYAITLGGAALSGQVLGGALIELNPGGLGWRTCFLVNVPVGLAALVLVKRVPESRAGGSRHLDLAGTVLVTLALVAIVLPLIEGRPHGWPPWTWVALVAAPALLGALTLHERRLATRGGNPLLHPQLFALRTFRIGVAAIVLFHITFASFYLILALELQEGRGLGPLESGLVFTFASAGFFIAALASSGLANRFGRRLLVAGALLRAPALVGAYFAAGHIASGGSIMWLAPALLIDGAGVGLFLGPVITTVLADVPPRYAGVASGVLSTAQNVGNALGVALVGVIFFGALDGGDSISDAFRLSLLYLAAGCIVVAALIHTMGRSDARAPTSAEEPTD
jgi:EmrB/QacA subfamily drug resistance transporter